MSGCRCTNAPMHSQLDIRFSMYKYLIILIFGASAVLVVMACALATFRLTELIGG